MRQDRLEQIRAIIHGPIVDELIVEIERCWQLIEDYKRVQHQDYQRED